MRVFLSDVVALIDELFEELITLQGRALIEFNTAADDLDSTLAEISQNDMLVKYRNYGLSTALGRRHSLEVVRSALAKCPDQIPIAATQSLLFIKDQAIRDGIRLDLSAVHDSIASGNWKAATDRSRESARNCPASGCRVAQRLFFT